MIFTALKNDLLVRGGLDLESLLDNIDALTISLSSKDQDLISVVFKDHLAYRCRDEGDALPK